MKKSALILGLAVVIIANFSGAYCAEQTPPDNKSSALIDTADMRYNKTPLNKLGRGVMNISTCYLEVPAGIFRVSKEKGEFVGFTVGMFQGFFTALIRGAVGLYDTVTFVIPSYSKPLMQPEYAFDSLDKAASDYDEFK